MKKNVMMRVASIMLVLVLMSSSVISGTFAKYVTEGTSQDKARVAKFGVEITGATDMFDSSYLKNDSSFTLDTHTVVSHGEINGREKVVAPGTRGGLTNIKITGEPEVAVRISHKVEKFDVGENWMVDTDATPGVDTFYCPIDITVTDAQGNTHVIRGLDFSDPVAFENAVIAKIEGATADYAVGSNKLSTLAPADILTVSWAWEFEGRAEHGGYGHDLQLDKYDTQLGDAAADLNPAFIDLSVTTYVTQID